MEENESKPVSYCFLFLRKTTQQIAIFEKKIFSKNQWILTFSLRGVLDLAQILLFRPKIAEKKQKLRSKNSTQNRKKRKNRNFLIFFLYLFISKKNHFRYGNERSLCPLLRTEEKIQEFQENRARRTSCEILKTRKIEKNKIKRLISLPKTY